jgi:V/A-type H+-transporting ATPase subunit I
MAISPMRKILVASYKDQAGALLEAIQQQGIMELLDSERAVVTKEWPELESIWERPRQIEDKLDKLEQTISFLKKYSPAKGGLAAALAPKAVIDENQFVGAVSSGQTNNKLEECLQVQKKIEHLATEIENASAQIQNLMPWESMQTPVEDIDSLQNATVLAGFLTGKNYLEAEKKLSQTAIFNRVGQIDTTVAFYVVCFKENTQEVQKFLRSLEFEAANFTGLKGTASQLIKDYKAKLVELEKELAQTHEQAKVLSSSLLDFKIMADYYRSALSRHNAQMTSPRSEQVFLYEGWVKKKDLPKLKKIVKQFTASSVSEIPIKKDEDIPVEIDNVNAVKPFEMVTRLYGMPHSTSVDPTVFLAPFFAIFMGLCVADVGYGLLLAVGLWWLMKKVQSGKAALQLFFICSFTTMLAGMATGSWFADTITTLIPATGRFAVIHNVREKLLISDPITNPMGFIAAMLAIGYFQIMFGFCVAMVRNILQKNFIAAICDQLVWLVFLNNFAVIALIKTGKIPAAFMPVSIAVALVCSVMIVLFAVREGSWGGRIGMGAFQLFSTVFFVGDILSYVRLVALAMVGAGFGMAINVLVKMLMDIPYIGFFAGALLFVVGHTFNVALSLLGAFVHSLRLQFVEFFPKFFVGGGTDFRPLTKEYKHIVIKE